MIPFVAALSLMTGGSCAGPDAESAMLIRAVSAWAPEGDSLRGAQATDSADVVLETDEEVCARLVEAYSKLPGEVDTPASLYVVRVGAGHFAIFDPNDMMGGSRTVMIFDRKMRLQSTYQARVVKS